MARTNVRKSPKGEQTRHKILDATIAVIASSGIKGTTHRAVAEQANIQLSLTTYYFTDIKHLVREAMELSAIRFVADNSNQWLQGFALIDSYSAADRRKLSVRKLLCEQLADLASRHMYDNIINRPQALAVEQIFFTEMMFSDELREIAHSHIYNLKQPFTKFCRYFNRVDPNVNAELMMIAFTRIQYMYLPLPPQSVKMSEIRMLVKRQLSWVMGLKT
ncbi:TetR/AcrR family transcriptional regulator [Thalassotalea mangrovi]|uniref:TetR family transcriptional regulator n=1 Tax=Thalassotalea mangrovi TaxID=2572245 RepID=A0A4U1B498_9GAMM|nr:TetR family transcriptional regulator [Thalassotalea mangrovi]TKB45100.1 TetR family transcriptional regulator [Thalassotalea mangrovi]